MSNRNIIIIFIAAIAISILLGSRFYEKKEINTCNWSENYSYSSKDPYGAWLFYELVVDRYGEENVYKNTIDTMHTKIDSGGYTYILMEDNYYTNEKQQEIIEFAEKGNEVLIIGHDNFSLITEVYAEMSGIHSNGDSIFYMTFLDENLNLEYKHYSRSIKEASPLYVSTVDITGRSNFTSLAMDTDSTTFFYKKTFPKATYFHHTAPILFSNIAGKQEFYLPHFDKIMSNFTHDKVIIDSHYYYRQKEYEYNDRSPIQYILQEKSLRWAYYTFLLTTLLFLIFRGKRKQRIIPVIEKNENTSIQYVDTLSDLFEHQDQNGKLVPHLEAIFYQRVKQKYFLKPEDENFVKLLARKSRIPENKIEAILTNLNTGKSGYEFNDDQLIVLYRRLEEFYQNAE